MIFSKLNLRQKLHLSWSLGYYHNNISSSLKTIGDINYPVIFNIFNVIETNFLKKNIIITLAYGSAESTIALNEDSMVFRDSWFRFESRIWLLLAEQIRFWQHVFLSIHFFCHGNLNVPTYWQTVKLKNKGNSFDSITKRKKNCWRIIGNHSYWRLS